MAGVTRLEVGSTAPYPGNPGFVRIDGTLHGEIDAREAFPGLERVARNARGRIEYAAPFVLIVPRERAAGNGALLIDVPNRGRAIAHHLYNSARDPYVELATFDSGNGFLQTHGFAVAMLQWELGYGITLPVFADEHGITRHVEAAGIAALRDFAYFLRHAEADAEGRPNPMYGMFDRTLAVGYSQTARVLKRMLVEGLDICGGRRVFDAMHLHGGAAGLADIRTTGAGPESGTSFTPRFENPKVRGVTEEPLSFAGIVERAAAHGPAVPKLLVTAMGTDYLSLRASLARSGAQGTIDLPIPPNVRIYDLAGASHSRAIESTCTLPPGRLDFFPVLRQTLLNLDAWAKDATEPPPSRLMPLEPRPGDAQVLQAPRHLPDAIVQAPLRDADGNALGGVRLPDIAAPLGVHGAQNAPLTEAPCNLIGAYLAFPDDTVRARYPTRDQYVARIRVAAQALVADRFISAEDAGLIEDAAQRASFW